MKKQDTFVRLQDNNYYILASSTYTDDLVHTLNFRDTFAVFDRWGDINPIGKGLQGIYHRGTRFISDMQLELNNYRPLLLSSNIKYENELLSVDLTNPALEDLDGNPVPQGVIHIARTKFLQDGACHELVSLHNYGSNAYSLQLNISCAGDFRDIFEIRGTPRKRRGELYPTRVMDNGALKLTYKGLDLRKRETVVRFDPCPEEITPQQAVFIIVLQPGDSFDIQCAAEFQTEEQWIPEESYEEAFSRIAPSLEKGKEIIAHIYTSNEQFNHWLNRSQNDLLSLLAPTPCGLYPYAGVPWYNTVFGRDGIITALETLWVAPDIARGVLAFLAARQATGASPQADAAPGKILHEMRYGEMAATGEVPFRQYYGSVDATPLFVVLAGHYVRRTNDLLFIAGIWDNIIAALQWIDTYGDVDGDGFMEYERTSPAGLVNQGWKDSHDAVSHADGRLATAPVALCEVQGYVYEARLQAAYLAERLGHHELAERWKAAAIELKRRFNEVFWDEQLGTYALALDGLKQPCLVVSSNAGHCLFSGIATPERAKRTAALLMSRKMFTGWGIRTLSATAPRYNPMSYHNGSVWPHDTALIAAGFARYGMTDKAMQLMQGLFDASLFLPLQRLPELFCGFDLRKGEAPTAYPVACSPQAWSVAAVFLLLQCCLQLSIDAAGKTLCFSGPQLPPYLESLKISRLPLGKEWMELEISRRTNGVAVNIVRQPAGWEIKVDQSTR